MIAHGSDPVTAVRQAYVATWGLIERQASMLSFVDTFLAMGIVFPLVLPLLFVMKRPRHSRGGAAMHSGLVVGRTVVPASQRPVGILAYCEWLMPLGWLRAWALPARNTSFP
jgi:hypothetical protein